MNSTLLQDQLVAAFAAELGWRGLERYSFRLGPEERCRIELDGQQVDPRGTLFTCWTTTHPKLFLQVNHLSDQPERYGAAVVAESRLVGHTWYEGCSFNTLKGAISQARRLASHCARANYRDPKWVRRFLEDHPERLYPQRKRWRGWKARLQTRARNFAAPR